jgi:hypothetical protein
VTAQAIDDGKRTDARTAAKVKVREILRRL